MSLIRETIRLNAKPEFDPATGIAKRVLLLGAESLNGRRYGIEARQKAAAKYEGAKGFLNHPEGETLERDVRDWFCTYQNVTVEADGTYADQHYLLEHPNYKQLAELAQKRWKDYGLSHVADCDAVKAADGIDDVREIREVFSVDLVIDPGHGRTLFESRSRRKPLKEIIEGAPAETPSRQIVLEMIAGTPELGAMQVAVPGASPAESQIAAAFADAVSQIVQDQTLDVAAKRKKLLVYLRAQDLIQKVESDMAADPNNPNAGNQTPDQKAAAEKAAKEQREKTEVQTLREKLEATEKRMLESDCRSLLMESNRFHVRPDGMKDDDWKPLDAANKLRLETLIRTPEDQRAALVESWPANKQPEQPGNVKREGRPDSSPPQNGGSPNGADRLKRYTERLAKTDEKVQKRLAERRK